MFAPQFCVKMKMWKLHDFAVLVSNGNNYYDDRNPFWLQSVFANK